MIMRSIKLNLLLFLLIILGKQSLNAQFFNNVNSELCFELFQKSDNLGPYRIYLVIDNETSFIADSTELYAIGKSPISRKVAIADRWRMQGKRVEVERAPFISYPVNIKKYRNDYNLQKINQKIDWENSPWKDGKEYWQYEDRPF
jgi:hypothetical protein